MIRAISLLDEMAAPPRTMDEGAGFGALKTESGCLPLAGLAMRARVTGLAAEITVRQIFRNTLDVPIEATYIFPLPDRAAVTSFRMEVAGRVIEGLLKERGEAREEYEKVKGALGSGAADKAAVQQVKEGDCSHKSCRVNCPDSDT